MANPIFSEKHLADLWGAYGTVSPRTNRMVIDFTWLAFKSPKAWEYAAQGFARRVRKLEWCIKRVFDVAAPEGVEMPSRETYHEIEAALQVFIANAFGSTDNLAWVWVHERWLAESIPRNHVGLRARNERVRESLSKEFQKYLLKLDEQWFPYITDYRDALAHRIPLYVPQRLSEKDRDRYNNLTLRMRNAIGSGRWKEHNALSEEQESLLVYQPLMTHSITETKGSFYFHSQMLCDFATVEELASKMLAELRAEAGNAR
jgi:hypothetical protein